MIKAIKGTRDILPPESALWNRVEGTARQIFDLYGFSEIRTPIFESTELFARGVGEDTDIVSKEMYTFEDRDDKSLTLRPEGTAPVVRAYIEHQLQKDSQIVKLYYLGPMFRRERPQKGRYRQFHQIGAEVMGSDNPAIEAEILEMLQLFLNRIGIQDQALLVNSIGCSNCRPRFLESLKEALAAKKEQLCVDCQRRSQTNPLRVLDCKVESCQPIIESLPKISEFLDEACRTHFDKFLGYLTARGISFTVVPRLVRGLDYYMRTTFEITSGALGAQNTLIGGGRYDSLSEMLGGPPTQGFGFALGLERILLVLQQTGNEAATSNPQIFLAPLGEKAFSKATLLAKDLRQQGVRCALDFETRSLKSAMRLANKLQANEVIIIGEDELLTEEYVVKSLLLGHQSKLAGQRIIRSPRRLEEMIIFDEFHKAFPNFAGREVTWKLGENPPDILCVDQDRKRVGVELTEWLDQNQMSASMQRENMERSYRDAIQSESLSRPQKIGKVLIYPKRPLKINEQMTFRLELLALLDEMSSGWSSFPQHNSPQGVPEDDFLDYSCLRDYLDSIAVFRLDTSSPSSGAPWIDFELHGEAYSSTSSTDALLSVIRKKTKKYKGLRASLGLDELYLLVYYNRALFHNSPVFEPTVGFEDIARNVSRKIADEHGTFQKSFLLYAIQQNIQVAQISPAMG